MPSRPHRRREIGRPGGGWPSLAAIALALLLAQAGSAAAAEAPEAAAEPGAGGEARDTWYAFALTSGAMGTMVVHYWSKGVKMRAETVVSGHPMVTLVDEQHYTMVDVLGGRGTRVARSKNSRAEDAERSRPFATELQEVLRRGGEKIRSEESLDVYRVTDEAGRKTVWVDPRAEVPVRVETFDRQSGQTSRVDYVGWMAGLPIADDFFTARAGIALQDVSYEDFVSRTGSAAMERIPVFYGALLHGHRPDE